MLIADRLFRRPRLAKEVRYVHEVGVLVADVEESLGGALGGAYDLDADALLALQVLDGLHVVAVAGDEGVGVGVVREAHHVHHDAYIPVALVRDRPLALGSEGLVNYERLGAYLVAELVEIVDEGAGRGGTLR